MPAMVDREERIESPEEIFVVEVEGIVDEAAAAVVTAVIEVEGEFMNESDKEVEVEATYS